MVNLESRPAESASRGAGSVEVLTPAVVSRLRLGWRNRHDAPEIVRVVRDYPDRSVWDPASGEFVLVGPWRHRDEIAVVQELAAVRNVDPLIAGLVDRCGRAGAALLVMIELDERRRPAFYERLGFQPLEEVVTYELNDPERDVSAGAPLRFVPVRAADEGRIAEATRIDHAAFPWLWQNSEREFAAYIGTSGVDVFLGLRDGVPVSYVGVTSYPGWGHLDRIAVDPVAQGGGIGRSSLAFAVAHLARCGAGRVGLSTQRDNHRSQRLYERFGFRLTGDNNYRLYGRWLATPR